MTTPIDDNMPHGSLSRGRPPFPAGQAATHHIHLRTTAARKSAYVRAAKPGKLTDWVFAQLDKAAKFEPEAR
jgi:hypothetical protein